MKVDQKLYDAAVALAQTRYPTGWAGAAAMYTADGQILTSVYVETPNSGGELCMETGCICEAHKLDMPISASICVSRESEDEPFIILSALRHLPGTPRLLGGRCSRRRTATGRPYEVVFQTAQRGSTVLLAQRFRVVLADLTRSNEESSRCVVCTALAAAL